ncbi:MAG: DUF2156 domain-containing protein [Candidatus Lokiarchaeota archaeon]|nr:DUF2156 domain-containing protein [Candidatus Lokiarchaeota archaeon]MBD3201592.1 DUF2156 domain-containing protein [Candidatus Lokiarchaeota archaeon]
MIFNNGKEIEISDKSLFNKYFEKYLPEISEFTFTNLFAWKEYYHFLFKEHKEHLILFSKDYLSRWGTDEEDNEDSLFVMPPIGPNPEKILLELFDSTENIAFHRVQESLIDNLRKIDDFQNLNIRVEEDRANWDYIYDKEELVKLSGNKYRSKRRFLETFKQEYDYQFHLISDEWLEQCKKLQNKWCMINECQKNKDLHQEQIAIDKLFDHFSELDYYGGIVLVDDKPAGYTIGEMLNDNTVVIHIEKAHTYYKGSYQAINNMFLTECCEKEAKYINREQDLGIEGLRKAKQSYHPIRMIKKYILYKE